MQSKNCLQEQAIPLPIPASLRQQVRQVANQQQDAEKRSQIYRNLLAVGVVKTYLEMMQIPVAQAASDSWNPIMQQYADVADVYLPSIGHLECRLMEAGQDGCTIPADVPDDRIGVIVVAVDDLEDRQARLVGFTPTVQSGWLAMTELQPMDHCLSYLSALENQLETVPFQVPLMQWLQGVLTRGWQTLDALLGADSPQLAYVYAFRQGGATSELGSQVGAGKLIEFASADGKFAVVLIVAMTQNPDTTVSLRIQLHPAEGDRCLPSQLKLALLTNQNELLQEVPSREADNFIQLPYFSCNAGESFKVQIALGETLMTETFLV